MANDDAVLDTTIDQYAGFNHKALPHDLEAPAWIPTSQHRRLRHYRIGDAYRRGVARLFLPSDSPKRRDWREQGDPAAISDRHAFAVLGDTVTIRVAGADTTLPPEPDLPPEPAVPTSDPDTSPAGQRIAQRRYDAALRSWEANAIDTIERWETDTDRLPKLHARQTSLRDWARTVRLEAKMRELYRELVMPMGEGVIVLTAQPGALPDLAIWEPDAYQPVWPEDGTLTEFPTKLHLAFEFTAPDPATGKDAQWIRRVTWELVDLRNPDQPDQPARRTGTAAPAYTDEATTTCLYSEGVWPAGAGSDGLDDLSDQAATWTEITDPATGDTVPAAGVDLGIDFIPVVHWPRELLTLSHHAPSIFVAYAQLLDSVASADTDSDRASALTAAPPIVARELRLTNDDGTSRYKPGMAWQGGKDSGLDALDMTGALAACDAHGELLRDRLAAMSASPKGLMGRGDTTQREVSGRAWQLSFTPFIQAVEAGRLALDAKGGLLLKFVQRLAIQSNAPGFEDAEVYPATLEPGAYMPDDVAGLINTIVQLATVDLLDPRTAYRWLADAGVDTGDIEDLVRALEERDIDRAVLLADTFGRKYGAEALGLPWSDTDDDHAATEAGDIDPDAGPVTPTIGPITLE